MSKCCLGDTFDIHGGGPDLTFPHHENEIAQSEAANDKPFVMTWMHAGAVRVNQEKMSKSLGNFFTIRDVLTEHDAEVVRFLLVASHYRSPINYAPDALSEARKSLTRFYTALEGVQVPTVDNSQTQPSAYHQRFFAAMDDDFNTPEALSAMFDLARELNRAKASGSEEVGLLASELKSLGDILGLLQQSPTEFLKGGGQGQSAPMDEAAIEAKIAERAEAKANKDFAAADGIRDALAEQGIILKDSREGTTWVLESR